MKVQVVPMWVGWVKQVKQVWTAEMETPDLPPVVMVARDNRLEAMVLANQVDARLGLKAADVLAIGFQPDALLFAVEICGKKIACDEQSPPAGQIQRELEAGSTKITEAVLIYEAKRTGQVSVWSLEYRGRGASFQWLDFGDVTSKFGGGMLDAIREIATDASGRQERHRQGIRDMAKKMGIPPPDHEYWHWSRASLRALEESGFRCFDFRDPPAGVEGKPLKTEEDGA